MTIDYNIRYEKLQYSINREAAKIAALSEGTFDKNEYSTGEKVLPSKQSIITEVYFIYYPFRKPFKKQIETY